MTTDDILTLIKEANDTFGDIAVKPTDNDMSYMKKTLLPILLNIPYNQVDATHNVSGIITPSAKYTTNYGISFKRLTCTGPYCPTITATMSDADRRKAKTTHSACK